MILILLVGTASVAAFAAEEIKTVIVTAAYVNVRDIGSISGNILGTAKKGAAFTHLGESGDYYKVVFGDKAGYIHKNLSKIVGEAGAPTGPSEGGPPRVLTVTSGYVNVRAGASTKHTIIGKEYRGAQFVYLGTVGSYHKVQYYNHKVGYIHRNLSTLSGSHKPGYHDHHGHHTWDHTDFYGAVHVVTVTSGYVNVRSGASTKHTIIGKEYTGAQFVCLGSAGSYYRIQYYNHMIGYIHKNLSRLSAAVAK